MLRYISLNEPSVSTQDKLLEQAASNTDMFAQASAMQLLCKEHKFTQSSLAKQLGISQATVGNKIRLLQYTHSERQVFLQHRLTERHARALLVVLPPKRAKLIETVATMHLNVRQTEELAEKYRIQGELTPADMRSPILREEPSVEHFLSQAGASVERLRATGIKVACITETGNGWKRLTVTFKDDCFT